jgi:hypothetical protein
LPGQVDTVSRACRVGKGKGNGERKRPKVRDGDEWHLQPRARRSRGPWRGGGEVAELYLHNASTSSPAGTCGAIPSRPLRRRSWRAPVGLGVGRPRDDGRGTDTDTQTAPAGRAVDGTPLSPGRGGRAARDRASPTPVRRPEPKRSPRGPRTRRPPCSAPASAASGLRGTLPRHGAGAWSRALRLLGTGPPQSAFRRRHNAATHTQTRTHNAPARCPLRFACSRFRCARRDPVPGEGGSLLPAPEKRGGEKKLRSSGGQRPQGQVPSHRGSRRVGGEARGVAGPAGGWVCAGGRRGGRGAAKERGAGRPSSREDPAVPSPSAPPPSPPPVRGARQVLGGAVPGPDRSSVCFGVPLPPCPPPLSSSARPAQLCAQTFSETPRSASSPNNRAGEEGGGEREGASEGGSERASERAAVREAPWDL